MVTNPATSVTTTGGVLERGREPERAVDERLVRVGDQPDAGHLQQHVHAVVGLRDDEPGGLRDAVGAYTRDAVLLPGGGFQLRGDVEGVDRKLQHAPAAVAPTVVTNPATSVTTTGGVLNGGVNPNGLSTNGWFEWGTSPTLATFSSTSSQSMGSGTTSQAISATLSGLASGTPYYFRVAASNSSGTSKGTIASFSTNASSRAPTVTTNAATSVTTTGGVLNGGVNPNGRATNAWFEWGTDPTLATFSSTSTQSMGSGTTSQSINRGAVGVDPRDAVLLPGGGFQLLGDVEGVDRQLQHDCRPPSLRRW